MFRLRRTVLVAVFVILCGGVTTLSPQTRGKRFRLEVHNHSSLVIENIYMSRSTDEDWGDDRLGLGVLEPKHYLPIENVIPDEYDFLIIDEHERKCMLMDHPVRKDLELEIDDKWLNTHCNKRGD